MEDENNKLKSNFDSKNPCLFNEILNKEILSFITEVQEVGEESISDYLVWKWRTSETPLKVIPFTRHYESSNSGADIELIFLLDDEYIRKPLVIQAKKIFTDTKKNIARDIIMYGREKGKVSRGHQIKTLQKYCQDKKVKKIPLYMFYSNPQKNIAIENPRCPNGQCGYKFDVNKIGVFVSPLISIQNLVKVSGISKHGYDTYDKITLEDVLDVSFPLHKIFCQRNNSEDDGDNQSEGANNPTLPDNGPSQNFTKFLNDFDEKIKTPNYVKELMKGNNSLDSIAKRYFSKDYMPKWIAIYDLSDKYTSNNDKQDIEKAKDGKDLSAEPSNINNRILGMGRRNNKTKLLKERPDKLVSAD